MDTEIVVIRLIWLYFCVYVGLAGYSENIEKPAQNKLNDLIKAVLVLYRYWIMVKNEY